MPAVTRTCLMTMNKKKKANHVPINRVTVNDINQNYDY